MSEEDTPDGHAPDAEAGRFWWRSRRGLRELDLLLLPFVEDVLPDLDAAERALYWRLIDREDSDLMPILTRRETTGDPELEAMVDRILAARREYT
ncbi:MAG: succinate dehydrogenase assembly factor 2 [Pseudomonadales bacterium]|jgi:antitoxin CptB|nr:succinate dehydrogenase assembly factor 2 [Pseudomonadales bacterium]